MIEIELETRVPPDAAPVFDVEVRAAEIDSLRPIALSTGESKERYGESENDPDAIGANSGGEVRSQ
jgi:hypothetical protein